MLGHVVFRYLSEMGHKALTVEDRFIGPERGEEFVAQINRQDPDWCINCIGVRSGSGVPPAQVDAVNHLLPSFCSQYLNENCGFVHASSDAVFSSQAGECSWERKMDPTDLYGQSKRDGELALLRENDLVIRCSIIGPEQGSPRSLMGWLFDQRETVSGFSNQWWNGVTTLEWAKECVALLTEEDRKDRVLQLASEPIVSKGELLRLIVECWNQPCEVQMEEGEVVV